MDDLFKELLEVPAIPKTTGMEKLIREIGILLDSSGFALYFKRNPLISELQMYDIKLARKSKKDENKMAVYYHDEGMELLPLLKRLKKYLEKWKENHKEYNRQKRRNGNSRM